MRKQIVNGVNFGVPVVVAINSFVTDTHDEIETIKRLSLQVRVINFSLLGIDLKIILSSKLKPVQLMQFYALTGLMVVPVLLT